MICEENVCSQNDLNCHNAEEFGPYIYGHVHCIWYEFVSNLNGLVETSRYRYRYRKRSGFVILDTLIRFQPKPDEGYLLMPIEILG